MITAVSSPSSLMAHRGARDHKSHLRVSCGSSTVRTCWQLDSSTSRRRWGLAAAALIWACCGSGGAEASDEMPSAMVCAAMANSVKASKKACLSAPADAPAHGNGTQDPRYDKVLADSPARRWCQGDIQT